MTPMRFLETTPCGRFGLITELGNEPDGYFWEGVAQVLVSTEAPRARGTFVL